MCQKLIISTVSSCLGLKSKVLKIRLFSQHTVLIGNHLIFLAYARSAMRFQTWNLVFQIISIYEEVGYKWKYDENNFGPLGTKFYSPSL